MIEVFEATPSEIDSLLDLEAALFVEDAGRHDPFADTAWPSREGRQDSRISSPHLMPSSSQRPSRKTVVGLLAGYAQKSSPTRQPVEYAVLRTMYVAHRARRRGVAAMLTERFLDWARSRGCAEAHVDHYAANLEAAALYAKSGFEERSVTSALML